MKALILGLAGALVLSVLPAEDSHAHDRWRHARSHVTIGFGYGYPRYYPHSYYYPSYAYGFDIWPRYRSTRAYTTRGEVRNRELYVYPAAGQSAARLAEDRSQCHAWAADAADYDPTRGAGTAAEAESYARAFTACMEGRDYVVK